ncbi:alpha/beta hydrolase [Antrihabitans cavernicola]|uniref:Alpha/beta hydrolase n=1 Tax=Antrihabitans cavernicola TaxID=2495913 RepID=A0A5A7SEU0_9NOCA|nr:alpha/beta hydrolase [Spelaeibacter cavernicola]KAA0024618.1 alpha/beta hydrolase [Spelaeibacter cavernicola]
MSVIERHAQTVRRSSQSRLAYEAFRWGIKPVVMAAPINGQSFRTAAMIEAVAGLRPQPTGITRERLQLNGFSAEVVRALGRARPLADGTVLYFHGGGFMCCGLNTHRPIVSSIAKRTGMSVVSVAYRQLPRTDFAGSVQDCVTAYRWLLERGVAPEKIVFAGDSAGGYLVFQTALAAIAAGLPSPAGLVGLSAWLDLDCTTKFAHSNARRDVIVTPAVLVELGKYGAAVDGVIDSASSPINGALAGLPPVLLIAAEGEVLRIDSEVMAARLTEAGVPCELQIWDGQVHAFVSVLPGLPESRRALADVARFIRARIEQVVVAQSA